MFEKIVKSFFCLSGQSFAWIPLCLMVGSCQKKETPASSHVLRINFQDGDLPATHPHIGIDYRMRSLQSALFEGLTRLDPEGIPQPAAAESIEVSEDGLRYVFTMRPARWSNGQPVTAHHFESAWKQAVAKDSLCRRSDLFYVIKNAESVRKGEKLLHEVGICAIDEWHFEVILEHPAPYFLELICNPIFSPLYDEAPEPTVFNGPFLLGSWKRDYLICLAKNPLYWDAASVGLDSIDISVVTEALTAAQLFEKGELDWIGSPFSSLPADMIPDWQKKGSLKTQEVSRIYWLYFNTEAFPFNNPWIRKALSYAIDRRSITDHVLLGQEPAGTPLPTSLTLVKEVGLPLSIDAIQARHFFAKGLAELNLTADQFPPITLSHSHITGQRQLAEIIQSHWQQTLGIQVKLEGAEWNVFFSNLSQGQYQVGGCLKSALFGDPIYHLELLEDKTTAYNVCRWEDPTYQKCLQQARITTHPEMRQKCLQEAEQILLQQMPVMPVYSERYLYSIRPHIKGVVMHELGHVDFKWITIDSTPSS